jgi:uncharacterized membrane protein HdeD (DUF308 family)
MKNRMDGIILAVAGFVFVAGLSLTFFSFFFGLFNVFAGIAMTIYLLRLTDKKKSQIPHTI